MTSWYSAAALPPDIVCKPRTLLAAQGFRVTGLFTTEWQSTSLELMHTGLVAYTDKDGKPKKFCCITSGCTVTSELHPKLQQPPEGFSTIHISHPRPGKRRPLSSYITIEASQAKAWVAKLSAIAARAPFQVGTEPCSPRYADKYCAVYDDRLEIFGCGFPAFTTKKVPVNRVIAAYSPSNVGWSNSKAWGMGADFAVWWACDMGRKLFRFDDQVVVDDGTWPMLGFTVKNKPAMIAALRAVVDGDDKLLGSDC